MIKKKRQKILIWAGGILAGLILLTMLASKYMAYKFKPMIKEQIRESVLKSTDSLYHIEFSSLRINMITANAALTDVRVVPDMRIYKKLVGLRKAPNNIYQVRLEKLVIRNFHLLRLLKHRKLDINELLLDNPSVLMVNRQFSFNDDRKPQPKKSPYDYISAYLKEFRIKTINFKNIRFKYVNNNLDKPVVDSVKNMNIQLKDFLVDETSAKDKTRLYLLKDIAINLNDYTFATPDSMYYIKLNQLDFAVSSGKLNIKRFALLPRYEEMKFAERLGYSKARYHIQMSDISLDGIDLPLYILKQELFAKEMTVANGAIQIFNNRLIPKRKDGLGGRFPQQLLEHAKGKVNIHKLILNKVDISYAEFSEKTHRKGIVTFENTSGTLSNVTNVERDVAKNPVMTADLTTHLMGKGRLYVLFKFDLLDKDAAFSYSGMLDAMEGRVLNRVTKPLGLIRIKSGHVKKLGFNITANKKRATGTMQFEYNDLSVALLKKDTLADRLVKNGLMSILANAMIINASNPGLDGKFVKADIDYERKPESSFFNFVWKTLFQGVKHSIGMTKEKEQKIRQQIARFVQMKHDREVRQSRREKRRAERARAESKKPH